MWKYYKKIFNYFKDKKLQIAIYFLTSLLIVGVNTIIPIFTAKSLEAITNVNLLNMLKYSLMVFIAELFYRLVSFINSDASSKVQDDVEIKIKEDVSKELFKLEMKNFDKEGTGFFAERINSEPRTLASIFLRIRYNFTEIFYIPWCSDLYFLSKYLFRNLFYFSFYIYFVF